MIRRTKAGTRIVVGLTVLTGVGLVLAGNAELLRASLLRQPDCVPHLGAPGQNGQFRAAQSSC